MDPDQLAWRRRRTMRATAYVAATNYKQDDFRPYLYKTSDYGKTWKKIVNGIPATHFTRVIREDPNREGLLVAGTEIGLYLSFDDGENWKPFQLNLPVHADHGPDVPQAREGTGGRDAGPVVLGARRYAAAVPVDGSRALKTEEVHLFQPKDAYRFGGGGRRRRRWRGRPAGRIRRMARSFTTAEGRPQGDVTLEFLDAAGKMVR